MTRDQALQLMHSYVSNENLRRHMLAVEAAVRFYAKKMGANEDLWGLAGLLHDADWEKYPSEHPKVIVEELRKRGVNEEVVYAISCHGNQFGMARRSQLDHVLFACDEITGLVTASALVRPNKLIGLEPRSVIKKMKDKSFAAGVNRQEVEQGAADLGLSLEEHIGNVIAAMTAIRGDLGL